MTNLERLQKFMASLGVEARAPGRVYFTGGATAVLMGWREMTIDVDLNADPEPEGFFAALPRIKHSMNLNVEIAAPHQFVPELPGWRERSHFIARHGAIDFFHYDFYGQALSKLERSHARDRHDLEKMADAGLILPRSMEKLFSQAQPSIVRYPAIDASLLAQRVQEYMIYIEHGNSHPA